jgi:hypothetical protein
MIDNGDNNGACPHFSGEDIELNLLTKDYVDGQEDIRLNITATELDQGTDGVYSEEELRRLLI